MIAHFIMHLTKTEYRTACGIKVHDYIYHTENKQGVTCRECRKIIGRMMKPKDLPTAEPH